MVKTPKNALYSVKYKSNTDTILITNTKTQKIKHFSPKNFIFGQIMFDENTDKYPGYVHLLVWELYEKG